MPPSTAMPARIPDPIARMAAIPLTLKLTLTAFVALLVPIYLDQYGVTNFLYFCDCALLMTTVGVWLESSLLISMAAVGITAIQTLWLADFLGHLLGFTVIGMTSYMFDGATPLYLRGLSLFHAWLPLLLLWLVHRLGYHPLALPAWTILGSVLMLISYLFLPAPPASVQHPLEPVNVNLVYGPSAAHPQTAMPPLAYLLLLLIGLPLVGYLPIHAFLRWWCPPPALVTPPDPWP
jgi:hypothetical protein